MIYASSHNFYNFASPISSKYVSNLTESNSKIGKRIYSTEKPVILLEYFLALYSKPGELVLDPFGGSASTGEASLHNGRKVILTERNKEY